MATQRQIAANRLNGLLGGVKTVEGKAVSRLNARKHGSYASLLVGNEPEEHRAILDDLTADLQPAGAVEEMLVDKLAATYLRMQRCALAEKAKYLDRRSYSEESRRYALGEDLQALGQHEQRLTNQFLRVLREIARRQEERKNADCGLRIAESRDCGLRIAPRSKPQSGAEECGMNGRKEEMKNEPNLSEVTAATRVADGGPALGDGSATPTVPQGRPVEIPCGQGSSATPSAS